MTDFVKEAKLTELENNFPDVSNLATKTALTAAENKITSVSSLVKKTDYNAKVTEVENKVNNHNHEKYIDTSEFNKLTADVCNATLALANLITKTDFDAALSSLNRKTTQNKTKHFLVKNELNKLKTFDSSYFIGKSHFAEVGTQKYLVFQPLIRYFEFITNTPHYISSWKTRGLSTESIKSPTTSDNSLAPALSYYGTKTKVKFTRSCLKQEKVTFDHKKIVKIYIVYELSKIATIGNNFPTLQNALFVVVTLTKNTDVDK